MEGAITQPVTLDDQTIDWLATRLIRLPRFRDGPAIATADLPSYMSDDAYPRDDQDFLDMPAILDDLADTDYGTHLAALVEWAEATSPWVDVVLDYRELRDGVPSDGPNLHTVAADNDDIGSRFSLSMWGDERGPYSAYHCRLDYWFDGDLEVRLAVFPDGTENIDPYAWADLPDELMLAGPSVADFDVTDVVASLDERMPYVTSRTVELHEKCGFPESQAHYRALHEAGLSNDAIAERRGVQDVRSYSTKASETIDAATRAFLAEGARGIPRRVIGSATVDVAGQGENVFEKKYVCVPSWYQNGATTEPGEGETWMEAPGAWLITVSNMQTKESTDDEENTQYDRGWGLSVTTTDFSSLSALLNHIEQKVFDHEVGVHNGSIDRIYAHDADHRKQLLDEIPEAYKRVANRTGRRSSVGIRDLDAIDPAGWWA